LRWRYYFDLVFVLTQKEMKVRYKNSFLGYLWSVAHPLLFALVFFVVFKIVMRLSMKNYTLFLICGLFPWQWFQNSVNLSPMMFQGNADIIKKVNFPTSTVAFASVMQDAIHFLLTIPVIIFFMLLYHQAPFASWIYGVPTLFVVQFTLTYGVSLGISSVSLFFRDLERLTLVLSMFAFYVTPVLYPETMIPSKYQSFIYLNPLAPLMIAWRSLFLDGVIPLTYLGFSMFYSLIAFLIGYSIYRKLSLRFAEIL